MHQPTHHLVLVSFPSSQQQTWAITNKIWLVGIEEIVGSTSFQTKIRLKVLVVLLLHQQVRVKIVGTKQKKDCTHRRCRTCCKSRGFDCSTHVKSTWVPAARRRERQQLIPPAAITAAGSSSHSTSSAKKPRLVHSQTNTTPSHTSTSNTTPPRSFDTSSSHQDASFKASLPGQVRAPAVFKCVRVTSVDDEEDEYAYQAVVRIGGHVFKGFLYDQGLEEAASKDGFPNLSDLHLGAAANVNQPSHDLYAGGFLGSSGSHYGNPLD